jgi:hypothetical protein
MGLFIDRVRFDEAPPSNEEIIALLEERVGSSYGLDAIERDGNELQITTMLEPVTRPYVLKILFERGGVRLDFATREPRPADLPPYVERPWKGHPWWTRAKIHLAFNLGLMSTALPRRTE